MFYVTVYDCHWSLLGGMKVDSDNMIKKKKEF